jgi:hypothetical protein
MKKLKSIFWGMLALLYISNSTAFAQESKYGSVLNPHGTVKILIVFAELEASCGDGQAGSWGTAAPPNADKYLDYQVSASPLTHITRYYKDMSLGELNVIGDYYDGTVQVSCTDFNTYGSTNAVIRKLNTVWQTTGGQYLTKHGLDLQSFDEYTNANGGQLKVKTPDGSIDAVLILWRNHPLHTCSNGYGVGNYMTPEPLKNKSTSVYGEWDYCPGTYNSPDGWDQFFQTEFMHALFGGNNFHIATGAAYGTQLWTSNAYSLNQGGVAKVACGWDRNFLDWKGTRQYPISAKNTSGTEVQTELSSTQQGVMYYVLEDFVTKGDAIRIKLPHSNWQTNGDKKNQYLWIENHQLTNQYDHNLYSSCQSWVPGLYAYVQAGKDILNGSMTYGGGYESPNQLNDWLFLLPAEGRWDFYYDLASKGNSGANCRWNNASVPYGIYYPDGSSLPNPFTGFTDTYGRIDSNGDGYIWSWETNEKPSSPSPAPAVDDYQPGWEKWLGIPSPSATKVLLSRGGDALDAFTTVGQKIGMATNPSTAPVYTLKEATATPSSYDNRSIHLNNMSIEIVNTNYYNVSSGPKAIQVKVRWDDQDIVSDTRWCGNVILANEGAMQMGINLLANKKITVDRGLSPTTYIKRTDGFFTEPSFLHLMAGTTTTLQSGAQLIVKNGSTFHMQAGSNLVIGANASVNIDATSVICIEQGANITFQDPATSKIIINGVAYSSAISIVNAVMSTTPYRAFNTINVYGLGGGGSTMPASGSVLLEAGRYIDITSNTYIAPSSAQSLIAQINTPVNNCTGAPFDVSLMKNDQLFLQNDNMLHKAENPNSELKNQEHNVLSIDRNDATDNNILVYPNPASTEIRWKTTRSNYAQAEISIFNATGILIYQGKSANAAEENIINTSKWKSGIYFLQVKSESNSYTQRFVLE